MRVISILLLSLIFSNVFGQEIDQREIKSEVKEVTVFLKGAQITRDKTINLPKGERVVKFVNLSPFIDAKSIQVKANGDIMVLSVNHQKNYLDKPKKATELVNLESKLEAIKEKIEIENAYLSIIKEELIFLQENRNIGGKSQTLTVTNLQQASDFYNRKLTSLKLKEIDRRKSLAKLIKERGDISNQMRTLSSKKEFPTGEILVKIDAKSSKDYLFELSYVVDNASWFPSYDIRAKNINEPVQLIYKANVQQDTKVDWINAKLKFSSADPNISGVAPELKTYLLNYHTAPPTYRSVSSNSVKGRVRCSEGSLPNATVTVDGTTIGTVTDIDGNYNITIPNNASSLTFSSIGYQYQTRPIVNGTINVTLQEDQSSLDEVVVYGFGTTESAPLRSSKRVAKKSPVQIRGASSIAMPTSQKENQITVDFEVNTPYTVKSDNKSYAVDLEHYNLPAFYQYYCVPKVNKDAFLIANITDWEKYNLLEGEANIFFEETYIGKTLLDVRSASDTLEISLGIDKKVSVDREKTEEFTDSKFIGNKREKTRAYKTTVKNNKSEPITMVILDQIPVPTTEEIEVTVENISGAKHNLKSGEIKWEFKLEPTGKREFELKYLVKHPKNKSLIVE